MATVGTLAVNVVANTQGFASGMERARAVTRTFNSGLGGAVGQLSGFAAKLGLAVSAAAALRSILGQLADSMNRIDDAAKTGQKIGATAQEIRALQRAGSLSGVDDLTNSLGKMEAVVGKARAGIKSSQEAFSRLGLDFNKLASESPMTALGEIADAINKLPTPADRAAAAMQIFGRAGKDMLPLLAEGSAGLAEMAKRSEELQGHLSDFDAHQVEEVNDALEDAKLAWQGVFDAVIIASAPAIKAVALFFETWARSYRAMLEFFGKSEPVADDASKMQADLAAIGEDMDIPAEGVAKISDRFKELLDRAADLRKEIATPMDVLSEKAAEAQELLAAGLITLDEYSQALSNAVVEWDQMEQKQRSAQQRQRVDVGAAVRGTTAGFSAINQGRQAADEQKRIAREAKEQRERMIVKLGEIADNPATPAIEVAEVRF